ncbi:MAG: hypothetical protein ACI8TP_000251 [Acidimicrobiales bacterium]|jgi:hypothetical protein
MTDRLTSDENGQFWDLASELMGSDNRLSEGTIMSSRCLRIAGARGKAEFLAMPHHLEDGLVVKLPRDRVGELIEAGTAESFAPAGKVFKEWAAVMTYNEDLWRSLLHESISFLGV